MTLTYPLPFIGSPPLNNRFLVVFFHGTPRGIKLNSAPNLIDVLFRSVSGIGSSVEMSSVPEGGQNLYTQQVPKGIKHDTLTLERGVVVPSLLTVEFERAMSEMKIKPAHVLVALLNNANVPVGAWLFLNALPIRWRLSNFNADENNVVIETMELTYQHRLTLSNFASVR